MLFSERNPKTPLWAGIIHINKRVYGGETDGVCLAQDLQDWCVLVCEERDTAWILLRWPHYLQHVLWSGRPIWGFRNKETCEWLWILPWQFPPHKAPPFVMATTGNQSALGCGCALWATEQTDGWAVNTISGASLFNNTFGNVRVSPAQSFHHATRGTFWPLPLPIFNSGQDSLCCWNALDGLNASCGKVNHNESSFISQLLLLCNNGMES